MSLCQRVGSPVDPQPSSTRLQPPPPSNPQFLLAGVFAAQFLLTILDPNQSKTWHLWWILFRLHTSSFAIATAAFFLIALLWNMIEWWGLPLFAKAKEKLGRRGGYQRVD